MSIFNKDIDRITTEDLADLLAEAAVENVRLEFKREVPAKDETLKKLSSFANTYGGLVIVGAAADSSDGKLVALPGVEVVNGYKQRLVQWCYEGIWPLLEPFVSGPIPSPVDTAKVCYVVSVPESLEAPHFLNGRKGAWIRTNEFSQRFDHHLAKYDELEHLRARRILLVERREQTIERAFLRFQTYLSSAHSSTTSSPNGPSESTMCLVVSPLLPGRQLASQKELENKVVSVRCRWRDVGYPSVSRKVTQKESVLLLNPSGEFSLFEATIFGQLFYAFDIVDSDTTLRGAPLPQCIHLYQLLGHILVVCQHAGELLTRLGYRGDVILRTRLLGIRNVPIVRPTDYGRITSAYSPLDDECELELSMDAERLISNRDDEARNLIRMLLFAVNWSNLAGDEGALDQLIVDGYRYNFWEPPRR